MKSTSSNKWPGLYFKSSTVLLIPACVVLLFMMLISFSAQSQQQDTTKTHQHDSLTILEKQQTKWSKADSASHKANSKIDSVQSAMNNATKPDIKKLALKWKENRAKKRAEKKRVDTTHILSDSLNTQVAKTPSDKSIKNDSVARTTSPKNLRKKAEQVSHFPDKVTNDLLNPDLHKIADRLKQKREQRLTEKEKTDTPKASKYEIDSLRTTQSDETNKTDSIRSAQHSSKKHISTDSLSKIRSSDGTKEVKLIDSKIAGAEAKISGKVNEPLAEVGKKLNAPIQDINKKTNAGLSKLSNEAMGKSDLPSDVALPGVSIPGTTSLNSVVTKELPLTDMNNSVAGKMKGTTDDLLKKDELHLDKVKNDIGNPLKEKKEESNKLKQELDSKVHDKMDGVTDSRQVNEVKDQSTKVNAATDKVQGYSKDIENIKKGDFEKADEVKKDVMEKLPSKEISGSQEQLKGLDQEKEKLKAWQNKEAFKKQTMAKAREEVVQQIITQNTKMMQAVDKISAYQKQGGAMAGMVKGLPKRPVKSRRPPFIERFVPGMTLQVQKGNMWLIDLNPTLRFKVRSILSTGLGYNYRVVIDQSGKYKREERISGFRSFTEFSIRKGLSIRADVERMSAYVPLIYAQPDVKERKYVWSYMIGLRKDFGLGAGVLGNVQFMYNIYDPKRESPYLNRLNVRFGFEFPLKKKAKSSN